LKKKAAFDVIVVGAGPAGSATAEALARTVPRVALLEEHEQVGLPNHCSGLISPRTLEVAGIAEEEVVVARYSEARVWGPGGKTLWLRSNAVQAVAVDRPRFDQMLAERAVEAGATLMLNARAQHCTRLEEGIAVEVETGGGETCLRAPLLIGADGANSKVARWMGMLRRCEVVPAIKADITFSGPGTDTIEIFVGSQVAPGWFGWVIPTGDGGARIGIGAARRPGDYVGAFLEGIRHRFGDYALHGTRRAALPLGPARGFVSDQTMLVGAAARQTKPTTGGGIYFGLRAARLAAETAAEAIARGDCSRRTLAAYERAWHCLDGQELAYGSWLRWGFRCLSDRDFDRLVALLGKPWAQRTISRLGDMDFPSRLFGSLMAILGQREARRRPVRGGQLANAGIGGGAE
jgi:geranylgeranyl reductase family protein